MLGSNRQPERLAEGHACGMVGSTTMRKSSKGALPCGTEGEGRLRQGVGRYATLRAAESRWSEETIDEMTED